MSVHLSVVLSDDLNREIDKVANETKARTSDVFLKDLRLYFAVRDARGAV